MVSVRGIGATHSGAGSVRPADRSARVIPSVLGPTPLIDHRGIIVLYAAASGSCNRVLQLCSAHAPVRHCHRELAACKVAGLQIRRPRPAHLPHRGRRYQSTRSIVQRREIECHLPTRRRYPACKIRCRRRPPFRPRAVHRSVYADPVSVRSWRIMVRKHNLRAAGRGAHRSRRLIRRDRRRQRADGALHCVAARQPVVEVLIQPGQFDVVAGCRRPLQLERYRRVRVFAHGGRIVLQRDLIQHLRTAGCRPDPQIRPVHGRIKRRVQRDTIRAHFLITELQTAQVAVR